VQCTYLGYLLLEAPREYVHHGPLLASTNSGFVPNMGPASEATLAEEVVYSPYDSCSHFTQRLFPPKLPRNIHELFLTIHSTSVISIVRHIHASNYIFYLHNIFTLSFLWIFMAGWLPSVPRDRYITEFKYLFTLHWV
jgi:hypothetical protein